MILLAPSAPAARRRRALRAAAATAVGVALVAVGLGPAAAVNADLGQQVVSADPADFTPQIMDGSVKSIAQIGSRIVAVGDFTTVRQKGSSADLTRNGIVAFDATTGALDPTFDTDFGSGFPRSVDTDGTYLYVGGSFSTVDGVINRRLARLTASGVLVPGLTTPDNAVNEVVVRGSRLFVGGKFSSFQGVARDGLAVLDTGTGQLLGSNLAFAGTYNGGGTAITRMDLDAAGSKLVAVGNFTSVGGQTRDQVAVVDATAAGALSLSPWSTTRFARASNSRCATVFETIMNDVDISPDGTYFVATTTGAFGGGSAAGTLCDTNSRWSLTATTSGQQPTWVNYTGGDTSFAVAITGGVVYVGGHFRWANNPFQGDQAGPGAVARDGIVALDAVNGLPLTWNPGRARGVGAEALLATSAGLWVGHDTNSIGGETRRRIAFMPLVGGSTLPATAAALLPNPVFLAERSSTGTTGGKLLRRQLASNGAPTSAAVVADTSFDWQTVRGAALVGQTLYYGLGDSRMYARSLDATTGAVGPARQVNLNNDPDNGAAIPFSISSLTGLVYDDASHRFYYTLSGSSSLYYRYFTPESETVGAQQLTTTTSVSMSTAAGLFSAGGRLFYGSSSDGALRSVAFANGVVSGTATVVSSDGTWRYRDMLVGTGTTVPNQPPTASFTASCDDQRACTFDAAGSTDADGRVTAWSWSFGNGQTGTGQQAVAGYPADGTYAVTLTVTDDRGATAQSTQQVAVVGAPPVGGDIALRATASSQGNLLSTFVTVPPAVQPGDLLVLSLTQSAARAVTGPTGAWTLQGTQTGAADEIRMSTWTKVAEVGDAGARVTVGVDARVKLAVSLLAYSGTSATAPVVSYAGASESQNRPAHTTPGTASAVPTNAWVVSLWADKSSATTTWDEPAGTTQRLEVWNDGNGRVSVLAADSGAAVSGVQPGLTATAGSSSSKAVAVTLVLSD